jgi:succinate dehydrogenase/fumarate reductase flavoprotein subunit/uncharacterized protein with FMN-binding domain
MKKMLTIGCCIIAALLVSAGISCASGAGGGAGGGRLTYADTIAWDGEYDVVVVGFGGAGAASAISAADAGASVLLTEKAPEGHEGGNTRYAAQLFVTAANPPKLLEYYKALRGEFKSTSDSMLETYVNGTAKLIDYVVSLGADPSQLLKWNDLGIQQLAVEYPEFPGGKEGLATYTVNRSVMEGALWKLLRRNVMDRSGKIDVWFEAPGKHLIQDPQSKTILGVQIEKQGKLVKIRAKNGVILTTGGFESNQAMVESYLGFHHAIPLGGVYNTGDGIIMAQEAGAALWHMSNFEGAGPFAGLAYEPNRAGSITGSTFLNNGGSVIVVGPDGSRYMDELAEGRHGHVKIGGSWIYPPRPEVSTMIFDETQRTTKGPVYPSWSADNSAEIRNGTLVSASTLAELGNKLGMPKLQQTVADFNAGAASGKDIFGRDPKTMAALNKGPYYALRLTQTILNTQGGPVRNENAEVVGLDGKPIPHLYSAGELGGITAHLYQGGGNLAECMVFGQIAGKNAAAPKAPLPEYRYPVKVSSHLVYTPGSGKSAEAAPALGPNEYLGEAQGMGGLLRVKVTMNGSRIEKVEIIHQTETAGIGERAFAAIPQAIISAQKADVAVVSGASVTSKAIIAAVKDALSAAGRNQ